MVEGVMTTMIDLFYNLREYKNVEFKIICPDIYLIDENNKQNSICLDFPETIKYYKYKSDFINIDRTNEVEYDKDRNDITCNIPFLQYNQNFGDISLSKCVEKEPANFEADIIICSARLLYEIISGANISLKYKRLLVIDSLDILKSKLGIFPNLESIIDGEAVFFVNPANKRNSKCNQQIYYNKFSERRLKWLAFSNIIKKKKRKEIINYSRKNKKKGEIFPNKYADNIGKSIFENIYLGYNVNYYPDGMFMNDGLSYYLNLFNIDAWKKHEPLTIPKGEIKEKLFFHNSDVLLGYI